MKDEDGDTKSVSEMLVEKLPIFVQSADLEVQERVSNISNIHQPMLQKAIKILFLFANVHQCKFQGKPSKYTPQQATARKRNELTSREWL